MLIRTLSVIAAVALGAATPALAAQKTALFAGGCFWSVEKALEAIPGVSGAVSGYAGGTLRNPTYERHDGYVEAVKVTYDPAKVSYAQLLSRFYRSIDPTDATGQICDKGPSYRTAVFVGDAGERAAADAEKARAEKLLGAKVAVQTRAAATFWPAEAYHQDFAKRNPVRYEQYRIGCGRDRVIKAVWAGR
jgi:peptide-methionine (S)-S-oxide reductase